MSSLIEQAAQRLEQLRQAGVVLPDDAQSPARAAPAPRYANPVVLANDQASVPDDIHAQASKYVELDLTALAAQGFLTPDAPRSTMADQYRVIKRPLINNAMGKGAATINHANLIMVT